MVEAEHEELGPVLEELCRAVGADAATLLLDTGDGTLQHAATFGRDRPRRGLMQLLRGNTEDAQTLVLTVAGSPGGLIVLSRPPGSQFTQQDRAVARLFARRLATAVVVDGSPVGRSGWTRQLEAIQRIAARLTRLASVEEVATTVCNETRAVVEHDEAHVLVVDESGRLRGVAATSNDPLGEKAVPPLSLDGLGGEAITRAAQGGVPILIPDAPQLGAQRPGPHSMLIVPLRYESRVTGVMCLVARGSRRFDDDDMRLLQILSDQAAVAIENARLLQGRDDLVRELAGLLEISEAAGAASDESQLARLLATRLRRATRTDAAIVARWDDDSTLMRVVARDGMAAPGETIDLVDSAARRRVLREGRPEIIHASGDDADGDARRLHSVGACSLVLLPLNAGGRTVGLVELIATGERRDPSPADMQACEAMASLAAMGLERVRVLEQLRSAADVDPLSGVHNHRYLQERLRQEIARSARSHSPLAVLMLDLDRFKPINDRHGHADGDLVLRNIAATIKAQVRASDIVARYGGDEFVVLMPDTAGDQAERVAHRVVAGVVDQRHQLSDGSRVGVGVSAGLAVYPTDGRTSAQLLQSADAAMYAAKRGGTNAIERSRPAPPPFEFGEPVAVRVIA